MRLFRRLSIVVSFLALVAVTWTGGFGFAGLGVQAAAPSAAPTVLDSYGGHPGLKATATGYFSRAYLDGRWWLIDPDGNVFYAAGVSQIDYHGLRSITGSNPYLSALKGKYGDPIDQAAWTAYTVDRLKSWGYNSLGALADPSLRAHLPYAADLSLVNELRKAVYAANGAQSDVYPLIWEKSQWDVNYRRYFFDVFHPLFESTAMSFLASEIAARGYASDRRLIGYMVDVELPLWIGRDSTPGSEWYSGNTLADVYIALPASANGKQEWVNQLRAAYGGSIGALNAAWGSAYSSFEELLNVGAVTSSNDAIRADKSRFLSSIYGKYYGTVSSALKAADPNHMYLGSRNIIYAVANPPELHQEIAKHVDAVSVNYYVWDNLTYEQLQQQMNGLFAEVYGGKPILITEYSFGGSDSGMPATHPNGAVVATQEERARLYRDYRRVAVASPYVVGDFWWAYFDPPREGSFWGNENSNYGLVDNDDHPYLRMLHPMSKESAEMYAQRGLTRQASPLITGVLASAPPSSAGVSPLNVASGNSSSVMAASGAAPASVASPSASHTIYLPVVFRTINPLGVVDFSFSLSQPVVSARLEIFDGNAPRAELKRALNLGGLSSGVNRIAWDGMSQTGEMVRAGTYYFVLKVTTAAGQTDYALESFSVLP